MSKKVYSLLTDQIISNLDKGVSWQQGWFSHLNPITGTEYQGINKLMLALDALVLKYDSFLWLTWNQVKQQGLRVKKGSTSSIVTYFSTIEVEKETEEGEVETKEIPLIRYYRVFNLSCLEGDKDKIEALKKKRSVSLSATAKDTLARLRNIVTLLGYTLQEHLEASCNFKTKTIKMPAVFKSESEQVLTLAHEIIHATAPALKRKPKQEDLKTYSFEELVAEIGACFLASKLGYQLKDTTNSAAYLKSWSKFLKESPKTTIYRAASQAEKAVEYIIKLEAKLAQVA